MLENKNELLVVVMLSFVSADETAVSLVVQITVGACLEFTSRQISDTDTNVFGEVRGDTDNSLDTTSVDGSSSLCTRDGSMGTAITNHNF